jgi:replicative DNA helicase
MARVARSALDLLPHDDQAERAVLGALLIDPDAIWRVSEVGLEPEHFHSEAYRLAYGALMGLAKAGKPTSDLVLVAEALAQITGTGGRTALDIIGGEAEVTGLILATPTSMNAAHYAQAVCDMALRRRVIALGADLATLGQGHEGDADDLRAQVLASVMALVGQGDTGESHLRGGYDYLAIQAARAARLAENPDALIHAGFPTLDEKLGDLTPSTVHAIAARSSVGKTMYLEHIAEHNARKGKRVVFYHGELDHQFMQDRRMARYAHIVTRELRRGYAGPEVQRAATEIARWSGNIVYVYCPGWTAERMALDIQRLAARGDCDLPIVDYLQLLALPPKNAYGYNVAQQRGQQVLTLKVACAQAGVPLVLASQVNRAAALNDGGRPELHNIRDTGNLEEYANQVVILHAPTPRTERPLDAKTEMLEAIIAKNMGGEPGIVNLIHLLGFYALAEAGDQEPPEPLSEDEHYEYIKF